MFIFITGIIFSEFAELHINKYICSMNSFTEKWYLNQLFRDSNFNSYTYLCFLILPTNSPGL